MFVLQAAVMKGRGGVLSAVLHYAAMFDAVGVTSACIYRGPAKQTLLGAGVQVIDAPAALSSPISVISPAVRALRDRVLEVSGGKAPDALIIHSDLTLAALKRSFPDAAVVTICHSDKLKRKDDADLVIVLNEGQERAARATLKHARVARLGNPFVAPAPAPLADGGPVRLNFVARFIPTKDPLALVNAAALLQAPPPLRFIGDGDLKPAVMAAAEAAGLEAEFPGWLWSPFTHFHRNDILVLPSDWEGLPYLLQEALQKGVPTIASDIPGNRTALGDGAFGALYPLRDNAALAAAIQAALDDLDALRAKAEMGRAALAERYGAAPFWRALRTELNLKAE
jgi:glycosyltransferase involved in cell wall biosynthesis